MDAGPAMEIQRELSSLEQSGILQQRKNGRRTYFKAGETRSLIFRELRSIFEKTVGLIPTLVAALMPFCNKIICAFVDGSVARHEERAASDVDLMVIWKHRAGRPGTSFAQSRKAARPGNECDKILNR